MNNTEVIKILYEIKDRLIPGGNYSNAIKSAIESLESLEDNNQITYGDMLKMFNKLIRQDNIIEDYRPNDKMCVGDLENKVGIRIWCKNGDSIVYYPNIEK